MSSGRHALFSLEDILSITDGRLAGGDAAGSAGGIRVMSVSIDSRSAGTGSLFVPLAGERTDGHRFILDALRSGSAVSLASEAWASREPGAAATAAATAPLVLVDDPLAALHRLARAHVARHPDLIRIGVSGSNGKTTTKEMIGSILSLAGPTVTNRGNLNSETGLPLSVLEIDGGHRYGVFEMAMDHAGEMASLAEILRPQIAVITGIGTAHIGRLGSQTVIAREKKEIFSRFSGSEAAFLPGEDPFFGFLAEGVNGTVIPFGPVHSSGFEGAEDLGLDGTAVHWEGLRIRLPFRGRYNLSNALAAASVARHLGIDREIVKAGLEAAQPLFGRGEILRGPFTVIRDCYNANPDSMREALTAFRNVPWEGRKVLLLGSMKELGAESSAAHGLLGEQVAGSGAVAVFLFGEEMAAVDRALATVGFTGHVRFGNDFDDLKREFDRFLRDGDLVLVKGSRSMELERFLPDSA